MQFTKPVITFVSLVIFATTFLPRHWWHQCDHAHQSATHTKHAHAADVTLSAQDCPICSVVMPWYTHATVLIFDKPRFKPLFDFGSIPQSAAAVSVDLHFSGRAPPVLY